MIRVQKLVVMAVVVLGLSAMAVYGNPWNIGINADSANVTATLAGGTLTISGTGSMRNIIAGVDGSNSDAPWSSFKNSITNVIIEEGVTMIGSNAFAGHANLASVTISEGVEAIGSHAFSMSGLTEIVIPNSVTLIAMSAFMGCTSLTSVTIGSGLNQILQGTFMGCTRLTSITIPDNIVHIGFGAFAVTGLTSVLLPSSVTSIDGYAFDDSNDLISITVLNPVPPTIIIEDGSNLATFSNTVLQNVILYVPEAAIEVYRSHAGWGLFNNINPATSVRNGNRVNSNILTPSVSIKGRTLNVKLPASMQSSSSQNLQVRMIDMRGRTVASFKIVNGVDNSLSLTKMPAGRYIVEIRNAGGRVGSTPLVVR